MTAFRYITHCAHVYIFLAPATRVALSTAELSLWIFSVYHNSWENLSSLSWSVRLCIFRVPSLGLCSVPDASLLVVGTAPPFSVILQSSTVAPVSFPAIALLVLASDGPLGIRSHREALPISFQFLFYKSLLSVYYSSNSLFFTKVCSNLPGEWRIPGSLQSS